ncbi:MAG: RNase adapter RapZ [Clostridiales bacterium]|nr:RNase adapter RapZ [Clostridiales bacterium]
MDLIIVTGLSGSGKSQAMNCLEDLGFYCIDNLPPALIKNFIDLAVQDKMKIEKAAFGIDIRGGEFFDDLKKGLEELKEAGMRFKVLFLEASDEVLIRRYKETRRVHPLATDGSIPDGIAREREKLMDIRKVADYIVDTSMMKVAQFHEELRNILSSDEATGFTITIQSFGYKHGIPLDADIVFDLRFIPNPYYLPSLRNLTGNSQKVRDYVMKFPQTRNFVDKAYAMIEELIPFYIKEGKANLVLAFGCTGGQHRSVAMANLFTEMFQEAGRRILTIHRDL